MNSNNVTYAQFIGFSSTPVLINDNSMQKFEMIFCSYFYCSSSSNAGCSFIACQNFLVSFTCFGYSFCHSGSTKSTASLHSSCDVTKADFISVVHCAEDKSLTDDAFYFKYGDAKISRVNVSSCTCAQSTGIQGTDNEQFSVSYLLAAEGNGWSSVETFKQDIESYIDHSVFINNSCSIGVIFLQNFGTMQFSDVIITQNIGKGFQDSKVKLKNCYYYSDYEPGISTNTPGLIMLNQPTMSWLTFHFDTKNCHPRLVGESTNRKKGAVRLIELLLIALSKGI